MLSSATQKLHKGSYLRKILSSLDVFTRLYFMYLYNFSKKYSNKYEIFIFHFHTWLRVRKKITKGSNGGDKESSRVDSEYKVQCVPTFVFWRKIFNIIFYTGRVRSWRWRWRYYHSFLYVSELRWINLQHNTMSVLQSEGPGHEAICLVLVYILSRTVSLHISCCYLMKKASHLN